MLRQKTGRHFVSDAVLRTLGDTPDITKRMPWRALRKAPSMFEDFTNPKWPPVSREVLNREKAVLKRGGGHFEDKAVETIVALRDRMGWDSSSIRSQLEEKGVAPERITELFSRHGITEERDRELDRKRYKHPVRPVIHGL